MRLRTGPHLRLPLSQPGEEISCRRSKTLLNCWVCKASARWGANLGLQQPISTLALIKKYEQLPPKASFTVVPSSGTMPLTVQFSDESLGYVTARNWKFDDGGTSTDPNPTHVYRIPKEEFTGSAFDLLGCFQWNPTLTVSNKAGSDTASGSVDVKPAPPVAKFSATAKWPCEALREFRGGSFGRSLPYTPLGFW